MDLTKFRAAIPNLDFYVRNIPCQQACPVHTDARGYVTAIAEGDYERAYLIARAPNPFASVCGRVCNAPCEAACRRGKVEPGQPVTIRALKRFVNDRFGIFDPSGTLERAKHAAFQFYRPTRADFDLENSALQHSISALKGRALARSGKRVAIVGSGPAGLSAAHDLALSGHAVTVFESAGTPGGMLVLGVPEYRLPRALVEMEIDAILSLGVELKLNHALGRDFQIADLKREFDAVFIGIGTYKSRKLNVEGEQQDGVLRAIDFLINVNLGGYNLDLGRRVLVIGGGNVAMDVARTAARTGQAESGDMQMALGVARAAIRTGKTKEVICLVVEARSEMLADPYEVAEAEEEGVVIYNHFAPARIVGKDGRATGVETLNVGRAFDDQKRFNPQLLPDTQRIWEADSVIISIGQTGELDWLKPEDGLTIGRGGTLQVDKNLMTTAPGIFAGGDIAFGPRLIIDAVANGQQAARGIHAYLGATSVKAARTATFTSIPLPLYEKRGPAKDYMRLKYERPPLTVVDRRIGITEVEERYSETVACAQGARCLHCSINTIFDGTRCILCNGCVDVCPYDCLKLVRVDQLEGDAALTEALSAWSQNANVTGGPAGGAAMLFDPDHCIRCGLCAQRCPTGAITMEDFRFKEML